MTEITQDADITLASTTETQEQLDHATGPNWRQPFAPKETAEGTETAAGAETDASKKTPASEPGTAEQNQEPKKGKAEPRTEDDEPLPKGVQKRIDRITARMREQEEELRALRTASQPRGQQQQQQQQQVNADPEPQVKDFKTWEEWNAAHTRWAVRDEQRTLSEKSAKEAEEARSRENFNDHLARVGQARIDHDDFDEKVKAVGTFEFSSPQANIAFQLGIVEADNGPELLYHLCTHPEEFAAFADMSPVKVQIALGRLSAALSPSTTNRVPMTKAPVSKTPPPSSAIRRTATAPTDLSDPKMATDDWIRKRNEQERNRRRS